jgi:hypothetical protein
MFAHATTEVTHLMPTLWFGVALRFVRISNLEQYAPIFKRATRKRIAA